MQLLDIAPSSAIFLMSPQPDLLSTLEPEDTARVERGAPFLHWCFGEAWIFVKYASQSLTAGL
jgi:hypothetical protein